MDGRGALGVGEAVDFKICLAKGIQDAGKFIGRNMADGNHQALFSEAPGNEVHSLQADDGHKCRRYGEGVHPGTARQADGSRHPKSGGGGDSSYDVLLKDNHAGADEAYAGYHLGRNTRRIEAPGKGVLRYEHKQGAAKGDEEVGPESGFLGPEFTLESYQAAQQAGNEQPQYEIPFYYHKTKVLKQSGSYIEPLEYRLPEDENQHPGECHHSDTELECVGLAVLVGIVQQGGRLAVERQHVAVLDKH